MQLALAHSRYTNFSAILPVLHEVDRRLGGEEGDALQVPLGSSRRFVLMKGLGFSAMVAVVQE